jgi:hypothetical protein
MTPSCTVGLDQNPARPDGAVGGVNLHALDTVDAFAGVMLFAAPLSEVC